jgi:hypothetical protein
MDVLWFCNTSKVSFLLLGGWGNYGTRLSPLRNQATGDCAGTLGIDLQLG